MSRECTGGRTSQCTESLEKRKHTHVIYAIVKVLLGFAVIVNLIQYLLVLASTC